MQDKFLILKDGYKTIVIATFIALIVNIFIGGFLGTISVFVMLFIVYIYRDSKRIISVSENGILAPVDGRVEAIDYVDGKQIIYCNTNLCDTQILLAPVSGNFEVTSYINGLNMSADNYKSKRLNQRATVEFSNLKLNLLSGVCNKEILIDENKKDIKQGERIGLFFSGSVIIEITKDAGLFVNIGDKLKAGETIIGKYNG